MVLCDPNILACREWKDLFIQLIEANVEVDFNQGLDIRLMTEEKAQMISRLNIPRIHFAWDRYEDKDKILPKFKLFADNNKERMKGHGNIVFTLVNYDTTIEQDLDRIYTLREMGFWAYIMIYDKEHCSRIYKEMQRWVNNRFIFAKCKTFEDYNNDKGSKRQTPHTQMATLFD